MEKIYNKLVRDNIPDIIISNNGEPITRTLDNLEYKQELEKKLYEEYKEVLEATGKDRLEELADMLEVMKYLAMLEDSSIEEVMTLSLKKNEKRGSFEKKIFLEKVIEKD